MNMKAIVNTGPGRLEWLDWPLPQPGAGQVRVRTAACGICATDLAMIAGWDRTGFPSIPGHEWSGVVEAAGEGVDRCLLGKPCVAENVQADGGEVGFEHPGGYGQYLLTEARNVCPLPAGFPPATATLIEPLAVCVRALRRLRVEDAGPVLIFGDGPIGLLTLLLLTTRKIDEVVMVGGRPRRLSVARELGAARTINYHDAGTDLIHAIGVGAKCGFANVIEASGAALAMRAAMDVAAKGGKVLVVGDYGDSRADFPWNHLLHRELEVIGSCASEGAWPETVRLATAGQLPLERLISRRLPASNYAEGIDLVRRSRDVIKVVLEWDAVGGGDPA